MSTLDNRSLMKQLDGRNYLSHILEVPDQIIEGFEVGQTATMPALYAQAKQVLILAPGEMAPVAQSAQALSLGYARVPVIVWEDYVLPKWVSSDTLVIALDFYGTNDTVLKAYSEAAAHKARLFSLSIGGDLARESRRWRAHHLTLAYGAPARVAFPYILAALVAVMKKLDLVEIKEATISEAAVLCRSLLENINPEVAQYQNNAKQLAEKIMGRKTVIVGSGPLLAITRKWLNSLTATGKGFVATLSLGEFNDTMINGMRGEGKALDTPLVIMLQSKYDHQRNKVQQTLTYQVAQAQKILYEQVFMHPSGSPFGELVLSSLLGEMVGYYIALLSHCDPSETTATEFIHEQLATAPVE